MAPPGNAFDRNNKATVMEMALIEMFCSYHVNKMEKCLCHHWSLSLLHYSVTFNPSVTGGGGGASRLPKVFSSITSDSHKL